jgi:hypothetical protein
MCYDSACPEVYTGNKSELVLILQLVLARTETRAAAARIP